MGTIQENIKKINTMKEEIAKRVGEKPEDILLVAVTKTRSAEEINEAIEGGITDIGENKVQEILDKYDRVNTVRWHMIGHLQTNKVKYIVDKVSLIHSVDSFKLAEEIDKRAGRLNKMMDILIQVNAAEEDSKFGTTIEETGLLIKTILDNCNNICIKGLMSIAPYADNPEDIRIFFKQVKKFYDEYSTLNHKNLNFKYLSMGMSHDYVTAIEEGSNLIRVGTAIFGPRNYSL